MNVPASEIVGLALLLDKSFDKKELLLPLNTPASQVAKASKVKCSTTYFVLEQLVERGIVVASRRGKTDIYRALEPQRVVDFYSRKLEYLRDAVPALEQLRRGAVQFPSHEIFKDAALVTGAGQPINSPQ